MVVFNTEVTVGGLRGLEIPGRVRCRKGVEETGEGRDSRYFS